MEEWLDISFLRKYTYIEKMRDNFQQITLTHRIGIQPKRKL